MSSIESVTTRFWMNKLNPEQLGINKIMEFKDGVRVILKTPNDDYEIVDAPYDEETKTIQFNDSETWRKVQLAIVLSADLTVEQFFQWDEYTNHFSFFDEYDDTSPLLVDFIIMTGYFDNSIYEQHKQVCMCPEKRIDMPMVNA